MRLVNTGAIWVKLISRLAAGILISDRNKDAVRLQGGFRRMQRSLRSEQLGRTA